MKYLKELQLETLDKTLRLWTLSFAAFMVLVFECCCGGCFMLITTTCVTNNSIFENIKTNWE